ncbi:MAG: hypothetical protein PHD67_03400 [Oscillospiraceae bacterium]|nr:hypothetical protein [Oscillospiraceae bacterium]
MAEKYGTKDQLKGKKGWENFWYYYKWHVVAGVFVAILAAILIRDLVTQEVYDATVFLSCDTYVTDEQAEQLCAKMETYVEDYDGKQETNIELGQAIFPENLETGDPNVVMAASTRLSATLLGDTAIFILDDAQYEKLKGEDLLMDLSERYPELQLEQSDRLPLAQTDLAQGIENLPEDLTVCVRRRDAMQKSDTEKVSAHYDYQMKLLDGIVHGA